jgi:hypothetical protein
MGCVGVLLLNMPCIGKHASLCSTRVVMWLFSRVLVFGLGVERCNHCQYFEGHSPLRDAVFLAVITRGVLGFGALFGVFMSLERGAL